MGIALILTLGFAVVELIAGWRAGSLALIADAGHMVTDGAALGLSALAAWLASLPPSRRHTYGLGKSELLAALINAVSMLVVVFFIGWEAWQRLQSPALIDGATVGVVAVIGLAINLLVAWILSRGEQNLNIRGALLHVMGDALGSVAAIVAGGVIYFTGWTPIDPLLSLLIGGLILFFKHQAAQGSPAWHAGWCTGTHQSGRTWSQPSRCSGGREVPRSACLADWRRAVGLVRPCAPRRPC